MNNQYGDAKGKQTAQLTKIEDIDRAVKHYFEKKLNLRVTTNSDSSSSQTVKVMFATGERWKLSKDNQNLRDKNGTLILPLLTIRTVNIDRTPGPLSMAQEVPSLTLAKQIHAKNSISRNLSYDRRVRGFPEKKVPTIYEYTTIPFPDFCTILYEISVWTQYQTQMNSILENIFYNYDHADSFVMPLDYDGKEIRGNNKYVVGYRDGSVVPTSNTIDFSEKERVIMYTYSIKVPCYLVLDPETDVLSYGKDKGSRESTGKPITYREQNVVDVKLKEGILTSAEFDKKFG